MRKIIGWFFYILGVIFFVLILVGAYVYVTDTFGFKSFVAVMTTPSMSQEVKQEVVLETQGASVPKKDKNPVLSEKQEAALESVGINPAAVPSSVTDTQKTCLINAVGEQRASDIKAGAIPTVPELLRAQACFQ